MRAKARRAAPDRRQMFALHEQIISLKRQITRIIAIKTATMRCVIVLIRKQMCMKTVDCNTWLHTMKHIVKVIRASRM